VLLIDEQQTLNDGDFRPCGDHPSRVHTGGSNFAFLDGHAKWKNPDFLSTADYVPNDSFHQEYWDTSGVMGTGNCVGGFPVVPQS